MSIAVVMIVRDEAARIERCLASLLPILSHWTCVDTGSTDGTQDIIRRVLADIPGELTERPFDNFGAARSDAYAKARGTADWLLASDADMVWTLEEGWQDDLAGVDAGMVEMGGADFGWRLPLILRGDLPWECRGAAHAYTTLPDRSYSSKPADKVRIARGNSWNQSKAEWQRDVLRTAVEKAPDDARSTFYLAQSLRDLGETDEARVLYAKRAAMGGWEEERWYAQYRAATLETDWPLRLAGLLSAWNARPGRLEPLYDAASGLIWRGEHRAAYGLASVPVVGDPPDELFVHRSVWNWGMAFVRSVGAWHVGRIDESRELGESLLHNPHLPDSFRAAVTSNLAYCGPRPRRATPRAFSKPPRVLILSDWEDTAGISTAIKRAFDRHTDWQVRAVRYANNYIDYPADIEYAGNEDEVARLFAECDIVHMMQRTSNASRYPGYADKPKVLHHHGTAFRQNPAAWLHEARGVGAVSLVSTIDLTLFAPDQLEWLPNPVDTSALRALRNGHGESDPLRLVHAPTSRGGKGTDVLIAAAAGLPVTLECIERSDWQSCLARKATGDLLFDQLAYGYGLNAIEAWAMGLPVIAGAQDPAVLDAMRSAIGYLPFHEAAEATLRDRLREVVEDRTLRRELAERGRQYVADFHDEAVVVERLKGIYARALDA